MTGALLLASVIWGSGAVFMQVCIDGGIETGLQMFFRFWIGALCLGALVHKKLRQINRRLLLCGALCGTLLFFSFFILIPWPGIYDASQQRFSLRQFRYAGSVYQLDYAENTAGTKGFYRLLFVPFGRGRSLLTVG